MAKRVKKKIKADVKSLESPKTNYGRRTSDREPYLKRAREAAEKTIPSLFPKEGTSGSTTFTTPEQSFGARALNFLASKISLAIMPPNTPMCRLVPPEDILDEAQENDTLSQEILKQLTRIEQKLLRFINANQIRVAVAEGSKQLVVAGNVLFYLPPESKGVRVYKLTDYTVQRDGFGNILEIITHEKIAWATIPTENQATIQKESGKSDQKDSDQFELYTRIALVKEKEAEPYYHSYQEIDGVILEDTVNIHPFDKLPWIATRLYKVDGEDYGRGFIEEYQGDLNSLEILSGALRDLAAIAASVRILVNPMGMTDPNKLAKAANGAFVAGREEDVRAFQLNKLADLQVAKAQADSIEARLSYAFLLNSAVQRSGERVTAEEIRYVAGELESTMGGIYSILSQEFQLPLVRLLLHQMETTGEIKEMGTSLSLVDIRIITGMEALGRGQDLANLEKFVSLVVQLAQAEGIDRLKLDGILTQAANALNLDSSTLVKTDEELAAEMATQEQQAVDQAGLMAGANSMGDMAGQLLQQQ